MEITHARQRIAAVATENGAVLIDGKRCTVAKIMVYQMSWMKVNYWEPLAEATRKLPNSRRSALLQPRAQTNNYITRQPHRSDQQPLLLTGKGDDFL